MKLFWGSTVFIALTCFTPVAFGQNTIWNNTGDDTFETASNWSLGVPVPGINTYILPGATSKTTTPNTFFPGGATDITITAASDHAANALIIASGFTGAGTIGSVTLTFAPGKTFTLGSELLLSNETLNYTGNLTVQSGAVLIGTNTGFNDGPSTLNFTNGTLDASTSSLNIGTFGGFTSTVNQTGSSTGTSVLAGSLNMGVQFGANPAGTGIYNITGTGPNNLTLSGGGSVSMGNAIFTQNETASIVDLSSSVSTNLGIASGDVATYNLLAGTLKMGNAILGEGTGSTGTLIQSAGTFSSNGGFIVGDHGIGNYTFSGGSADFQNGFAVGGFSGGSGQIIQSNGTLTSEGTALVGGATGTGAGSYTLQSGSATFSNGLTVGVTGIVNQSGGTLSIAAGSQLDLSAVGSVYNFSSGLLQVGNNGLAGTSGQGKLNLGSGTLQITSGGTFTDSLDSTLNGAATIDATHAGLTNVTLAGNLNGSGGLSFNGDGTTVFKLTGNDTYTGATGIKNGTLNLAPNVGTGTITSNALNIGTAGTLNLNLNAGGLGYSGNIGGTGQLNANFANAGDVLAIKNTSTFTGGITLGANGTRGTLQIYDGNYGNINEIGTGSAVTIGGALPGGLPGAFTTPTSGTVTLGNATYTGDTTVNSGFTLKASSLAGNVINNGTLGSSAALSAGPHTPTLTINGNLNSSNTLIVRLNPTNADLIQVNGTANISGKVQVVGAAGTGQFTILNTNAAGDLTVGSITTNSPSPLLQVLVTADPAAPTQRLLVTTLQGTLGAVVATGNAGAVAGALDPIIVDNNVNGTPIPTSFTPILAALDNSGSASQITEELKQLSPEVLQYSRNIAFENSTFLVQNVNGALANLRSGYSGLDTNGVSVLTPGFTGGMARSLLAYNSPFHSAAPNGVNYYPDSDDSSSSSSSSSATSSSPSALPDSSGQTISDSPIPLRTTNHTVLRSPNNFSEFIGGDVILADLNQNQNAANAPSQQASYTAGDAYAGISFRMTSKLAVGVLFDYNHTDAKLDDSGSRTKIDSYSPGAYATYFDHGFYVNGLFAFGYNVYNNDRNIPFLGRTATSSPNGQQYTSNLDFGYDFHPDNSWTVGPTLGVTYTHLDIDSFSETGAGGANLSVDSQSADSLRSRLGGHVVYQTHVGSILLQPNFTAMWQHEYLNQSSGITSEFSIPGSNSFTIQTASQDKNSGLIGCGLTATLDNGLGFYLNYMADVGASDYFAQTVMGGIKASF